MLLEAPSPGEYPWAWISVDNNLLLVVTRKGKLLIDEVDTKKTTLLKEALPRVFKRCAFSPDGKYFVAIGA